MTFCLFFYLPSRRLTENCCCCKLGRFCLTTIDCDQHLNQVELFVVDCNCWLILWIWIGSLIGGYWLNLFFLLIDLLLVDWFVFYWLSLLLVLVVSWSGWFWFLLDWVGCFVFHWSRVDFYWLFCALLIAIVVLQDCIVCGCKSFDCWFLWLLYHHDRTLEVGVENCCCW